MDALNAGITEERDKELGMIAQMSWEKGTWKEMISFLIGASVTRYELAYTALKMGMIIQEQVDTRERGDNDENSDKSDTGEAGKGA